MLDRLPGEAPLMQVEKKAFCLVCKRVVSRWEVFEKNGKYYKRCKKCETVYPAKKPSIES